MTGRRLRTGFPTSVAMASPLLASLPILLLAATLFTAGYVLLWMGVNVGPSVLPLWALLLVLGFVTCIGAVISWSFVEESRSDRERGEAADAAVVATGRSPELGRPRPNVGPSTRGSVGGAPDGLAPWDEGPSLTPTRSGPDGEPTLGPGPLHGEAGRVLEEIDGIEREVASRRKADATIFR
jgi:hypothetical protein